GCNGMKSSAMSTSAAAELTHLIEELTAIRADMIALAEHSADLLRGVHSQHQASARNLLHYLALRSRDLRPLQSQLAALGLSSLAGPESPVRPRVDAVVTALHRLSDRGSEQLAPADTPLDFAAGQQMLDEHTAAVLGPRRSERAAIMVTMPSEAAE